MRRIHVSALAIVLMTSSLVGGQVVMIEGESAGTAVGRASRLGKGNWHRVGSIALFTYFVSMSLMWALTLPVLAALYLLGMVGDDFYSSSTWNVFYI